MTSPTSRGPRSAYFDGTGERVSRSPWLYDGRRPAGYGGEPERRTLGGIAASVHAARAYSVAHPRTAVSVYVSPLCAPWEFRAGKRVQP